jgi:hypothetical protein
MTVLEAFGRHPEQFLPLATGGDEQLVMAELTPTMQMVERNCPHSEANVEKTERSDDSFYIDAEKGARVYGDGREEHLSLAQWRDYQNIGMVPGNLPYPHEQVPEKSQERPSTVIQGRLRQFHDDGTLVPLNAAERAEHIEKENAERNRTHSPGIGR